MKIFLNSKELEFLIHDLQCAVRHLKKFTFSSYGEAWNYPERSLKLLKDKQKFVKEKNERNNLES